MEKMTVEKLQDLAKQNMEDTVMVARVLEALKPFQGKPINKKLGTAVQAALPEYTVSYQDNDKKLFNWVHIGIWGNGIPHQERYSLTIHVTPEFDLAVFQEKNPAYFAAAIARNKRREQFIADTEKLAMLAELINQHNEATEKLREVLGEWDDNAGQYDGSVIADRYAIEKLLKAKI